MTSAEMRDRTKRFALRIVRLSAALPRNRAGDVFGRQLLKAGTSVGANYRESLRASSKRQFISIMEIALREADETLYWLELIGEAGVMKPSRLRDLYKECSELVAILVQTVKTAKRRPRK
jgi:four helix bundle protein